MATYANITNTETADETAPQPPVAVDDFDQYGILSAQLNVRATTPFPPGTFSLSHTVSSPPFFKMRRSGMT